MLIGEIRRATDAGYKYRAKVIWAACVDCGKERWVFLKNGKLQNLRCCRCRSLGKKNPNYQGGRFVACDNCGKKVYRVPYRIRDQEHQFCNSKCMGEWQSRSTEFAIKVFKGNQLKPNKQELFLKSVLEESNLPYKYVGDGEFILGGRCPDFLNTNGQKKLIELFGKHWHDPKYFPNVQSPQERIDYFTDYGFQTLIIWETELKDLVLLKEKLHKFDLVEATV